MRHMHRASQRTMRLEWVSGNAADSSQGAATPRKAPPSSACFVRTAGPPLGGRALGRTPSTHAAPGAITCSGASAYATSCSECPLSWPAVGKNRSCSRHAVPFFALIDAVDAAAHVDGAGVGRNDEGCGLVPKPQTARAAALFIRHSFG